MTATDSLQLALSKAHDISARRQNMSTVAMVNAAIGSGSYANGIAAACLSVGGVHAPLAESMALLSLDDPVAKVKQLLAAGSRVPGWGNSFIKGKPDPDWLEVDRMLAADWPDLYSKIADVTKFLHKNGKQVFPNPSTYTAAVALLVGMQPKLAAYLFIAGRLRAWTEIIGGHLQ